MRPLYKTVVLMIIVANTCATAMALPSSTCENNPIIQWNGDGNGKLVCSNGTVTISAIPKLTDFLIYTTITGYTQPKYTIQPDGGTVFKSQPTCSLTQSSTKPQVQCTYRITTGAGQNSIVITNQSSTMISVGATDNSKGYMSTIPSLPSLPPPSCAIPSNWTPQSQSSQNYNCPHLNKNTQKIETLDCWVPEIHNIMPSSYGHKQNLIIETRYGIYIPCGNYTVSKENCAACYSANKSNF